MAAKMMNGARAKVYFTDPNTGGKTRLIGIFDNFDYSVVYGAAATKILGAYSAQSIDYLSYEPVHISASGWRIVGHGARVAASVPKLQDLMKHEPIDISVIDRQSGEAVAVIHSVRPLGFSTGFTAGQLTKMQLPYMGILEDDESSSGGGNANAEASDAATLPA